MDNSSGAKSGGHTVIDDVVTGVAADECSADDARGADRFGEILEVARQILSASRVVLQRDETLDAVAEVGASASGVPSGEIRLELAEPIWLRWFDSIQQRPPAGLRPLVDLIERCIKQQAVAPWALLMIASDGEVRAASNRLSRYVGIPAIEAIGLSVFRFIHPDDQHLALDSLLRTVQFPGENSPLDIRAVHRDGSNSLVEITAQELVEGQDDSLLITVEPAETRPLSEGVVADQLRLLDMIGRGERLESTLNEIVRLARRRLKAGCALLVRERPRAHLRVQSSDGLSAALIASLDGTNVAAGSNPCGLAALSGHVLRSPTAQTDPDWHQQLPHFVADGIERTWVGPLLSRHVDRTIGSLAFFGGPFWSPSSTDVRLIELFASLASVAIQRSQVESVLQFQANHDHLTGLPNRTLFLERLDAALAARWEDSAEVAVLFVDLDRFKVINDALGHDCGDEVLVAVADRLLTAVRSGGSVARFGGDEFTILADGIRQASDAVAIGERIVAAFRAPLQTSSGEMTLTVSVGIALSGLVRLCAADMLRDADAAMYEAKRRGKNRVEVFGAGMREQALERLEFSHALHNAVGRNAFSLDFQPQIDLQAQVIDATEALLRWRRSDSRILSAGEFVAVAEETGAIHPLGQWVLDQACSQAKSWATGSDRPLRVWVNVSVNELLQTEFVERIKRALEHHSIAPQLIGFEVTESALSTHFDAAATALHRLRDLGVATAIDDFGTGFASLSSLRRLAVDFIKIDGSFINEIGPNLRGLALVSAIIDLVHATGGQVVAEGVETAEQFSALCRIGCDRAQGYWIGAPAPSDRVASHLTDFGWEPAHRA